MEESNECKPSGNVSTESLWSIKPCEHFARKYDLELFKVEISALETLNVMSLFSVFLELCHLGSDDL